MGKNKALMAVVAKLVATFHPNLIYLFGSQARGDSGPDSDFDLLILLEKREETRVKLAQKAYLALWEIEEVIPCDIVVYAKDEFNRYRNIIGTLPEIVAREGKTLYAA